MTKEVEISTNDTLVHLQQRLEHERLYILTRDETSEERKRERKYNNQSLNILKEDTNRRD